MADGVQEEEGVLKSGVVYGGLSPLKSKKSFYCVLRERVVELHESEKAQKKNKTPKLIIDLAICFNVNRKFDSKLKECVAIMMPDECYVLRAETDEQTEDWFDAFIAAAIPARALHLGRPVLRDEFFECAWDVTLVKYPKLKKTPVRTDMEDLCAKNSSLCGERRLCFYPHAIVICQRGIEPATIGVPTSCIPPFKKEDFLEFQLVFVANFGKQEKYFFMRMGRSAPTGSGEIWAMAESGEVATDMHNKLNKIVERESEKKRTLGVGPLVHPRTASSARHGPSAAHRERANTQPQRQRTPSFDNAEDPLMAPSPLTKFMESCEREGSLKQRRFLRGFKARVDSFEEEQGMLSNASAGSASFASADVVSCSLPTSSASRNRLTGSPAPIGVGSLPAQRKTSEQPFPAYHTGPIVTHTAPFAWTPPSSSQNVARSNSIGAQSPHSASSVGGSSGKRQSEILKSPPIQEESSGDYTAMQTDSTRPDENEDSGGTLRLDPFDSMSGTPVQKTAPRNVLDMDGRLQDYMTMAQQPDPPAKGTDYTEMGVTEDATARWIESATDYTPMDASTPPIASSSSGGSASHLAVPSAYQSWNLEEVRSYVSDSSDSCYSSMGGPTAVAGAPRAYSFGSRGARGTGGAHHSMLHGRRGDVSPVLRSANAGGSSSAVVNQPIDDSARITAALNEERKRAYSLGNKSWFSKPFRKISQLSLSRHVDPSASESGELRGRSDSFGSGRSTPFSRKEPGVRSSVSASHDKDLVEFDFGGPIGRSPSGSLASCESPSRSRTSSFGQASRDEHHGHRGPSPHANTPMRAVTSPSSEKPSDLYIANMLRKAALIEEITPPSNIDSSDYVLSDSPHTTVVKAVVEARPKFIDDEDAVFGASSDYELMRAADDPVTPQPQQQPQQHPYENVQLRPPYSAAPQLSVRTSGVFETIVEASSGKSSRKSSTSSLIAPSPVAAELKPTTSKPTTPKPTTPKPSPIGRLFNTFASPKLDCKKTSPMSSAENSPAIIDDDYAPMVVGKMELEPPASLPKRGSVSSLQLQTQTSVPDGLAAARTQPNSPAVRDCDELNYACLQLPPSASAASATSLSSAGGALKESDPGANSTDYAVVDVSKCKSVRTSSRGQLSPR